MAGRSLVPLVRRDPDALAVWPDDVFFQISESQVGRGVRTHRWKYSVSAPDKNGNRDPALTITWKSSCMICSPTLTN
jgi:hypothetical protein